MIDQEYVYTDDGEWVFNSRPSVLLEMIVHDRVYIEMEISELVYN